MLALDYAVGAVGQPRHRIGLALPPPSIGGRPRIAGERRELVAARERRLRHGGAALPAAPVFIGRATPKAGPRPRPPSRPLHVRRPNALIEPIPLCCRPWLAASLPI